MIVLLKFVSVRLTIGESLLTSLFTFSSLTCIRLNSEKPSVAYELNSEVEKADWLEQFVQFSAFCKQEWRKYQRSKTAKLLSGKNVNEPYVLCKISSMLRRISPKPFGISSSNFQRQLKLLCSFNIQRFFSISSIG